MAKTMGQAIDEATKQHESTYPQSRVFAARVSEHEVLSGVWLVEVDAEHFSCTLHYPVDMHR